jgi:predicted nucleotidyltransferase
VSLQIAIDAEGPAAVRRRTGIPRLSFFAPVLREDVGPESDIDLHAPAGLSHFFREDVVDSAAVAYAA